MISNEQRFQELRDQYIKLKLKKDKSHLIFLHSFCDYCQAIGMKKEQIQLGVGIVTGCEPYLNQSWKDVRCYDDDETAFNIDLDKRLNK